MSMIGEYARLTPAELDHAVRDSGWAQEFVYELIDAEVDGDPHASQLRCLDIDKAWDSPSFLLRRVSFPVDIVHGEEELPEADDWGYGPPRYLTPEQVRTAAVALAATPSHTLIGSATVRELAQADLYPSITEDDEQWLAYVAHHYEALTPYFQAAAQDGDAMIIWLD
jgi:hypothetical protein